MKLQTGDVILVDTEGFVASTIDEVQGNDWNHAGFVINISGKTFIFEAIPSGVAFTPLDDYIKRMEDEDINILHLRHKYVNWKTVDDIKLLHFLLPLTKAFYGYDNLIIYQLVKYITKKLFGKEIWIGKGEKKSTKRFICGKLVAYIFHHNFGIFKEWWKVAPVDIYKDKDFERINIYM